MVEGSGLVDPFGQLYHCGVVPHEQRWIDSYRPERVAEEVTEKIDLLLLLGLPYFEAIISRAACFVPDGQSGR